MRRNTLLALMLLAALTLPTEAHACGGFFCNAGTLSPIYQAGERVVFAQGANGGTTMHIEIAYQGEPTDFGWILPIEPPRDANGQILPLDQILQVSTADLFNQLARRTDPVYQVNNTFDMHSCQAPDTGIFFDAATTADTSLNSGTDTGSTTEPPPVVVLQQANVGPYGAELVQATSADALYAWLNDNGYVQDPKALPLLEHYIQKDFIFLGLRLQSGKVAGDIRPVQLNLGETFACVPLRLTAIAVTENMPMLVWVLGPHRAIPKNFLHAVVNPLALTWPGASNYVDVVSEAINTLAGRAFVTEYASTEKIMDQAFYNGAIARVHSDLESAETLDDVLHAIDRLGGVRGELLDLVKAYIPMPTDLRGYPHGNCYYDAGWEEPVPGGGADVYGYYDYCEANDEHITTEAEFYTFLDFWLTELEAAETPLTVDIEAFRLAVLDSYIAPRERIQSMFDNASWITRFYTTISGNEMTRDPIFSFNPDLPAHDNVHTLETVIKNDSTCEDNWVVATYETNDQVRFTCDRSRCTDRRTLGPIAGQPALLRAEVADESGAPLLFDPEQADSVDALLDQANPGRPTLPESFILTPPPTRGTLTLAVDEQDDVHVLNSGLASGGCSCTVATSGSSHSKPLSLALILGLGALVVTRRKKR